MNVAIITLGCAKNAVDSSYMRASIEAGGGTLVEDPADADAIVINTCGFIEPAKMESIETILDAASYKEEGRDVKIIVTGCLAQRYRDELAKELPEVDLFTDLAGEKEIWELLNGKKDGFYGGDPGAHWRVGRETVEHSPSAYLMIADGCSNRCAFCAIPLIRGPYRSRSMEEILSEAKGLIAAGARELNLIAQDTAAYGLDLYRERRLPALVRELDSLDDVRWIRLLYAQPQHITDELIETMASSEKVLSYLDLPLQHASSRIIQSMRRSGSRQSYLQLVERLRGAMPEIALRSAVILGYPGETDDDFDTLVDFVSEANLDYLGIFDFSPEEGTEAATLPDQVPPDVVAERNRQLSSLRDDMMLKKSASRVGKTAEIMVEAVEDGNIIGRAPWQAPEVDGNVRLDRRTEIGSFHTVAITASDGFDYEATTIAGAGE